MLEMKSVLLALFGHSWLMAYKNSTNSDHNPSLGICLLYKDSDGWLQVLNAAMQLLSHHMVQQMINQKNRKT